MFTGNYTFGPCPRCGQRDALIFGPDQKGQMRCDDCNEVFSLTWLFEFISTWLPFAIGFQKAIVGEAELSKLTRG